MKASLYSHGWNIIKYGFDYKNALDNWAEHADEIVVAINTSEDGSYEAIESYAKKKGYPVKMVSTTFDFSTDSFAYGKVVNAALQGCTGDIMIQQDMDERIRFSPDFIDMAYKYLTSSGLKALMIPTIDLYMEKEKYCRVGSKWYLHLPGLFRGAVGFGLKADGKPDYNKTSTDELINNKGELVPYAQLWQGKDEDLKGYVDAGMMLVYHLGYLNLTDRVERAVWWKSFWERATGGDPNSHCTSIEELMKRETKLHGLPLWSPQP